jgi:hypothetical protein
MWRAHYLLDRMSGTAGPSVISMMKHGVACSQVNTARTKILSRGAVRFGAGSASAAAPPVKEKNAITSYRCAAVHEKSLLRIQRSRKKIRKTHGELSDTPPCSRIMLAMTRAQLRANRAATSQRNHNRLPQPSSLSTCHARARPEHLSALFCVDVFLKNHIDVFSGIASSFFSKSRRRFFSPDARKRTRFSAPRAYRPSSLVASSTPFTVSGNMRWWPIRSRISSVDPEYSHPEGCVGFSQTRCG